MNTLYVMNVFMYHAYMINNKKRLFVDWKLFSRWVNIFFVGGGGVA